METKNYTWLYLHLLKNIKPNIILKKEKKAEKLPNNKILPLIKATIKHKKKL